MKILLISPYFSLIGGTEIVFYSTYNALRKAGHEVYIFSTDFKPYIEDNCEYAYFTKYTGGIKNFLKNPIRYFYNFEAQKNFKTILQEIKPDIVHIHSLECFTGSILELCKDIPTVYTVHCASLFCPTSTLMINNKKYCEKQLCRKNNYLPCILNKCSRGKLEPSIRLALMYYIKNKNLKYIDKFITPSEALKNAVINSNIGICENNIKVINNFLTPQELKTIPKYTNKGYFLYVGRLSKEKGVKYLLQAIKELPKELILHIVGTGPEEENLKAFVVENQLSNIKFLGFKNREDITEQYQNCIATILPSNCFEIFGLTNIESAINGKPVIASNIGGIPEIVEHNRTGLLFEPANISQLKDCIFQYWNNKDLVIEHGKNAYNKAIECYNEDVYLRKLTDLYEETISEYSK